MKCFYYFKDKNRVNGQRSAPTLKYQSKSYTSEAESEIKSSSSAPSPRGLSELYEEKAQNLRVFKFSELKQATSNFNRLLKIGAGGFGCVYKGTIKPVDEKGDPFVVAIKKLNTDGNQGHKEWVTEVKFLGVVDHPNLVKLIGYCAVDGERGIQRLLVYEYMPNKSLEDHLFNISFPTLSWDQRLQIALGAAKGLAYLHEELEVQVIYRDFKSSNILLDKDFKPKLSDFGLAREGPVDGKTHVSTAIQQVFRRMFPFGRGLCHAYWAPNFWVFYIILDKLLAFLSVKLGFNIQAPTASFTGGLVGDSSPFAVLPTITPLITLITVLLAITPCLIRAWRDPQPRMVTRWVAYAYACGFLFGWHVHEKASLHFVIPLSITALKSAEDAKLYFFLSTVSCYSLFPLLFEAQEYPIKVSLLLLHAVLMWFGFTSHFSESKVRKASSSVLEKDDKLKSPNIDRNAEFVVGWCGKAYLFGLFVVEIWGRFLHPLIFGNRLPFLPLMMISIYCALGMTYSWIWQLRYIAKSR